MVQSAVEDDGFPDNLAPPKQNMVKRGENTSYLGQAQEFQMSRKKTIFRQNQSQFCKRSCKKVALYNTIYIIKGRNAIGATSCDMKCVKRSPVAARAKKGWRRRRQEEEEEERIFSFEDLKTCLKKNKKYLMKICNFMICSTRPHSRWRRRG